MSYAIDVLHDEKRELENRLYCLNSDIVNEVWSQGALYVYNLTSEQEDEHRQRAEYNIREQARDANRWLKEVNEALLILKSCGGENKNELYKKENKHELYP